jgi:hypothetical protein
MVKGTGAEPDRKHGARNPRLLVFLLATKRRGVCTKARGDVAYPSTENTSTASRVSRRTR